MHCKDSGRSSWRSLSPSQCKDSGRSSWRSLSPSYAVSLLKEESSQRQVNLPGMQNGKFRYPCGLPSQVSTEWTDSVVPDRPGLSASPLGCRLSTHCSRRPVAVIVLDTIDQEAVPADHRRCACCYRLLAVDRRCSFAAFLGTTCIVLSRHCSLLCWLSHNPNHTKYNGTYIGDPNVCSIVFCVI